MTDYLLIDDDVDNLERYSKEFVMAKRSNGESFQSKKELWRNSEMFWRIKAKRFGVKGSYGETFWSKRELWRI